MVERARESREVKEKMYEDYPWVNKEKVLCA